MKLSFPFRTLGLLSVSLLGWYSCSNDFDLTVPAKDVPVVYGLLSLNDTAHYFRVERAFIDPEISAYQLAQNPDSLYYPNAEVMLVASDGSSFPMTRVDGNLEGYPRKEGIFAKAPNYLYKLRSSEVSLQGGNDYKLVVRPNFSDLQEASATTRLLSPFEITSPAPDKNVSISNYNQNVRVGWTSGDNASVFDIYITYHYQETEPGGSEYTSKQIEQPLVRNEPIVAGASPTYFFRAGEIYRFLEGNLVKDPTIRRIFNKMTFRVTMGGKEFNDIRLLNIANSGIGGAQVAPEYTNIENGLGVFSSRVSDISDNVTLTQMSLDSLRKGIYTEALNFQ